MRLFNRLVLASLTILLFAAPMPAQQKPAAEANRLIPLKVDVVLSEYDGAKKISSLPYTLAANAGPTMHTYLRLGVKVPVQTGQNQYQYQDVGTNIDCSAWPLSDGTYKLDITITRDSVYVVGVDGHGEGLQADSKQPVIRHFSVSNTLVLRNGQTDESTVATDPVSGHTIRVSVTLHVVKSSS
jgi:hypothetical protein